MAGWISSVLPVVTFVLGAVFTYARDLLTEKHQIRREREARQGEREKLILDRRETFELDHLQRLNEALQAMGRATGRAHHLDMMASRQTGTYASTQLTTEASDAFYEANRNVSMLKNLVLDDRLRELVAVAHGALNIPSAMHGSDPAYADHEFERAIILTDQAQNGLAERIRHIYLTAGA